MRVLLIFAFALSGFVLSGQNTIDLAPITVRPAEYLRGILAEARTRAPDLYPKQRLYLPAYFRSHAVSDGRLAQTTEALVNFRDGPYHYPPLAARAYVRSFRATPDSTNSRFYRRFTDATLYLIYEDTNPIRSGEWFRPDARLAETGRQIIDRDTIVTIAVTPPFPEPAFRLWVNLSDYAIVRYEKGGPTAAVHKDVRYERRNGRFYPASIRKRTHYDYDDGRRLTQSYYLVFYDAAAGDDLRPRGKERGKMASREENVRTFRGIYRPEMWFDPPVMLNQ